MFTTVGGRVAHIYGTRHSVATGRWRSRHAVPGGSVARFRAVAEDSIVALRIGRARQAAVVGLVANQRRITRISVIQATQHRIANLLSIAEQTVAAGRAVGRMSALIGRLVAGIGGARNAVGAIERRAGLATLGQMTGFGSVAKQSVAALAVVWRVIAGIRRLVARIRRAGNVICAIGSRPGLTTLSQVTSFGSVAVKPIIAKSIVGLMRTCIVVFVA